MEQYNEQFVDVFAYAKENIFNGREQFGEAIASKLYRHGYIYCCEEDVLAYIKAMLENAKIPFVVKVAPDTTINDYEIVIGDGQ